MESQEYQGSIITRNMEPNQPGYRPGGINDLRPILATFVVSLETRRRSIRNYKTEDGTNAAGPKINQCHREKKSIVDEHCEQGTCDTQIFYFVANDRNSSRPGGEKNEDMPAPKQRGGKKCMPKGRTERFIMPKGVRKIRTVVGRSHGGVKSKKK